MKNPEMQAYLILETGEIYEGVSNGAKKIMRSGEVVFNTSHTGYEEIATDPSYFRQIVVMTAPQQGNYSVDKKVWESDRIFIEGFIALQIQNSKRDHDWIQRLSDSQVPVVSEIDTRQLTKRLRSGGTPWGSLFAGYTKDEALKLYQSAIAEARKGDKDWVYQVSRKKPEIRKGKLASGPRIAVLDFGSKENILRELESRCSEIHIFSSRASFEEVQACKPQGLMLTNGPGDPSDVEVAPQVIQKFLKQIPVFGICMGHQVLALAMGAQTYKLKFGHRGANHPIRDEILNEIYMSSQNHGYAVKADTLPKTTKVTHTNLNDRTVAGFYDETLNGLGIQYHPESCPGPHEAQKLFDFFTQRMIR